MTNCSTTNWSQRAYFSFPVCFLLIFNPLILHFVYEYLCTWMCICVGCVYVLYEVGVCACEYGEVVCVMWSGLCVHVCVHVNVYVGVCVCVLCEVDCVCMWMCVWMGLMCVCVVWSGGCSHVCWVCVSLQVYTPMGVYSKAQTRHCDLPVALRVSHWTWNSLLH